MATKVKLIADGVITPDQITLTTASTGTNTTAPATTAFVQQEISALVDSSPDALNTLNELAAALDDDANFSTTVTDSIATKLPLAGGTLTGALTTRDVTVSDGYILVDGGTTSNTTLEAVLWARSQIGASIPQLNVQGDQWQFGGGGTLDTSPTMTVDYGSGNVGIGTSNPPHKFSVFGTGAGNATVQIEGEGGADPYINFLANNTQHWSVGIDDSDSDKFKISEHSGLGTNDYLVVDTSGNVGIGTSSPTRKLHVNSGIEGISAGIAGSTYGIRFDNGGSYSSNMSTIHGVDDTLTGSYQPIMLNGSDVRFGTSTTERMRIDSSGNVDINTGRLKIINSGTDAYFLEGVRDGGNTTLRMYDNNNNLYIDSYTNMSFRANQTGGGSGGNFSFGGGNVGIGLPSGSPDKILHLKSNSVNNSMIKIESTATNSYPGIQIVNDAQAWEISTHGAHSDALTFYNGTNHTMKLDTSGAIVANLKGTSSTTAATGLIIHGGGQSDETEGGVGGATNTFVTNMNRQIVLQFRAGASTGYAHAIHTRHNSGHRGNNTIDFYNWEHGTAANALPAKRSFSIHPKAIELVPTTTAERDLFNSGNFAYDGMLIYNSNEKKFQGRVDGAWQNITAGDDFPVTTDLYARYTADSFTNNGSSTAPSWTDLSGNGRNITTTSTSTGGGFWARSGSTWPTKVSSSAANGALSTFNCVQFDTSEGMALPDKSTIASAATTGFTFAYVARYTVSGERIMAGDGSNNLVGFWGGARGVFFDGAWLVGPSSQHSADATDWTIIILSGDTAASKTKDNNSGNFVSTSLTFNYTSATYSATGARYGLNYHDHGLGGNNSEKSSFEIAEWAMWDRNLTSSELTSLKGFLETKYGI